MQIVKSPLRYPGGKSRALEQIRKYFPNDFEEFREPFVGGGTVFVYVRQRHPKVRVWINDLNYEVFAFWICARDQLEEMVAEVSRIKKNTTDGRKLFKELTTVDVSKLTQLERAVRFFVLNRITFSGTVESGGYSEKSFHARFTLSSIERLGALESIMQDVQITNFDYRKVIHQPGRRVFIYLDPPYYSATESRLYGRNGTLHTSFDHDSFAQEMSKCHHRWLITYDDSEKIKKNFGFAHQLPWKLQYGMNNYKRSYAEKGNELILTDYPLKPEPKAHQLAMFEKKAGYKAKKRPMTGDEFVKHKVSPEHRATVETIRQLMRETAPGANEVIAYGTLGWKIKGVIAVINPTKKYVAVAFLRGAQFEDRYGMLEGGGKKQKLVKIKYTDVDTTALRYYTRQAVKSDKK